MVPAYTYLEEADLSFADLAGANLICAELMYAHLTKAILNRTILCDAKLGGSYLENTDLSEANLSCADLEGAYLTNADLTHANLAGANLTRAKLDNAKILGTMLELLSLNSSRLKNVRRDNYPTWENLLFDFESEVKITEVLDARNLLFFPNSAARITTTNGRENREPDFIVCDKTSKGFKWGILEIDNLHPSPERQTKEQEIERDFELNGVKVFRFYSKRCYREPNKVVDEFLELLSIN